MPTFTEILTTKGEQLFAKALSGSATITFTKMVMGNGEVSSSLRKSLTAIASPVVTLDIESVTKTSDNVINVKSIFTNADLEDGFYFREKGVYATDGTTEILFIYGNNGSLAEWIQPPTSSVTEKIISSILTFSESDEISITLQSGIYALEADFQELKQEVEENTNNIGDLSNLEPDSDNLVDAINEAFQSASNGKAAITAAITGVDPDVTIPTDATFTQLATAIGQIQTGVDTSDATATASQILAGLTAYVKGVKVTGTISSKSAATYSPSTSAQTIAAGQYLSGAQTISATTGTANTGQVLSGYTFNSANGIGLTGTISSKSAATYGPSTSAQTISAGQYLSGAQTIAATTGTANTGQVLSGYTFNSANGIGLTGTISSKSAATYTPGTSSQTISAGQYLSGAQTISGDSNLLSSNILSGVSIFGVAGSVIAGKQYQSGTYLPSSAGISFNVGSNSSSDTADFYSVIVSGLTFTPTIILATSAASTTYTCFTFYRGDVDLFGSSYNNTRIITAYTYYNANNSSTETQGIKLTGNAYVNSTGFQLPVILRSTYNWIAFA